MSMSLVQGGNSPRFERMYGGAEARQPERSERASRRTSDDGDASERSPRGIDDGPGRRNPLVSALMQALKSLVPASGAAAGTAATTSTTTTSPTASADAGTVRPTTDTDATADTAATATTSESANSSGDLKDAAYAFAHELFGALRSLGDDGNRGSRGQHHGHHHHGHRAGGSSDYGDLAQGLQRLANALGGSKTSAAAATAEAASATAEAAATNAPSTTSSTVADTAAAPDATAVASTPTAPVAAGGSVSINISIDIKFNAPAAKTASPQGGESPLLAAFKRLADKLNAPLTGGTSTESTSPAEKLKTFLLTMADALKAGRSNAASTLPPVGSLLNLAA